MKLFIPILIASLLLTCSHAKAQNISIKMEDLTALEFKEAVEKSSGDGSKATAEAGELILDSITEQFAEVIRSIKADTNVPTLMEQFFKDSKNPLGTPQPYEIRP